jgi:uncharacterized protein (PEP-CTERM system associated)
LPPLAVLAVALALPERTGAATWNVVPSLRWRESYTDNINLAPPASAQADLASELAPGISVSTSMPRLQLNASYLLQLVAYQHRPSSRSHTLQAGMHAIAVPDWLQFEARSSISRRQVSPFGAQENDAIQQDANTTEVRSHALAPFLRHRFIGLASVDLHSSIEQVSTGDSNLHSRSVERGLGLVGDTTGALGWSAQVRRRHVDDSAFAPVDLDTWSASLRLKMSGQLALAGTVGAEHNSFRSNEGDGRFWNASMSWTPSPRTSLTASTGRRFFGKTYGLDASHRTRRSLWRLAYVEDITTTHFQQFSLDAERSSTALNQWWQASIPDPIVRQAEIDRVLGGAGLHFISHGYYLQKLLTASLALTGAQQTFLLSYSANRRNALSINSVSAENLPPGDSALFDMTRQQALDANWRWLASPDTTLSVAANRSRISSDSTGASASNLALRAGLSHRFQRRLDGVIDVRHARHGGLPGTAYRENAVSASLHYRF